MAKRFAKGNLVDELKRTEISRVMQAHELQEDGALPTTALALLAGDVNAPRHVSTVLPS